MKSKKIDCENLEFWAIIVCVSLTSLFLFIFLFCSGCSDPMTQGIAIGVGASETAIGATDMAKESKTILIAEILRLRTKLAAAPTPRALTAIQEKLTTAEKKQEVIELTESIATVITEGIGRDWGEKPTSPESGPNNLAWILGTLATLATTYAGKKTLDDRAKAKAIRRVTIAAKPEQEKEVYSAIEG